MARGYQKSNREKRKPRAQKPKPVARTFALRAVVRAWAPQSAICLRRAGSAPGDRAPAAVTRGANGATQVQSRPVRRLQAWALERRTLRKQIRDPASASC